MGVQLIDGSILPLPAEQSVKIHCGFFYHHGIADGLGYVIHNSKLQGKVVRDTEHTFSDGKEVLYSDIDGQDPKNAVQRAYTLIGMPYDLVLSNCEQFVRLCHGLEPITPQVQKYLIASTGAAIAMKSNNRALQVSGIAAALVAALTPPDKSPIPSVLLTVSVVLGLCVISN